MDSGHIYWTDSGDGTIKEVPLAGGRVTTLVTGQDNPEGLAVDSGHIYWANNDLSGTINEAPLPGRPGDHPGHRAGQPGRSSGQPVGATARWQVCRTAAN